MEASPMSAAASSPSMRFSSPPGEPLQRSSPGQVAVHTEERLEMGHQSAVQKVKKKYSTRTARVTVLVLVLFIWVFMQLGNHFDPYWQPFFVAISIVALMLLMKAASDYLSNNDQLREYWKVSWMLFNLMFILMFAGFYMSDDDSTMEGVFEGGSSPFWNALYFSATTHFTVGYGDLLPKSSFSRRLAVVQHMVSFYINVIEIVDPYTYGLRPRR